MRNMRRLKLVSILLGGHDWENIILQGVRHEMGDTVIVEIE